MNAHQTTGPALADPFFRNQPSRSLKSAGGRYHFFPRTSFNRALSSMASAKSFFRRPFSSSCALQPFGLRNLHAAVLRCPAVERLLRDPVLAAHRDRRNLPVLRLPQNPDDPLFSVSDPPRSSSPSLKIYGKLTQCADRFSGIRSPSPPLLHQSAGNAATMPSARTMNAMV